ncbi:flagellar basal body rod protein FlgB [Thermotoga sp. KOL6]|uniref:flagellar basal body rod protein FlgB n=1 Tax=Thermotoga sp. KOL6 TaxID=126741 RepID=UPI000C77EDCD|nr:flagellar basal body rod protein FlgB [Thermotoga sp. KOL6]PLV60016.1 flagellar biosynthesis protein FlgB [Thermotoga sp. KOL6]
MFNSNFYTLKQAMDVSLLRQKVYSLNIANVSTPGYKRKYVAFEEYLKESEMKLRLSTTNEKHIDSSKRDITPRILTQNNTTMRNDGNNVDIDYEIVQLVKNGLRYQVLTRLMSLNIDRYNAVLRGVR